VTRNLIPSFVESTAFIQLLRDCGGLPQYVQIVCEEVSAYYKRNTILPMRDWDWVYIQDQVIERINRTYHTIPMDAIVGCLVGISVWRTDSIADTTWERLEMSGGIVITPKFRPVIPFLKLLSMVRKTTGDELRQLSICPMVNSPEAERCFNWQQWEIFNMEFAVMKLKVLFKYYAGM